MGSINEKTVVELKNCQIVSVEAGNVNKVAEEDTVVAFTVKVTNDIFKKRYKLLLKGTLAASIYNAFLANGGTVTKSLFEGVKIEKVVTVSFIAFKREEREFEIVLEKPSDIEFNFNYKLVG